MGDKGMIETLEDAEEVISNVWIAEYKKYGYARYALIHKEDNKLIGFCGMKYLPEDDAPDLGYRMLKKYWGQGLGFEAAQAALNYGREHLGLNDIFVAINTENIASNKIAQKLGFQLESQFEDLGFVLNRYK